MKLSQGKKIALLVIQIFYLGSFLKQLEFFLFILHYHYSGDYLL